MLDVYKKLSSAIGCFLLFAAPVSAVIALLNLSSKAGFGGFVFLVILQPALIAFSGLGAIAFAELIDLIQVTRDEVLGIKRFIDESRRRQAKKEQDHASQRHP